LLLAASSASSNGEDGSQEEEPHHDVKRHRRSKRRMRRGKKNVGGVDGTGMNNDGDGSGSSSGPGHVETKLLLSSGSSTTTKSLPSSSLFAPKRNPMSIDSLSDPTLMHIAETLGTAPEQGDFLEGARFLCDITSMAQTCQRWKKVVRGSDDLWRSICEWRWVPVKMKGHWFVEDVMSHSPTLPRAVKGSQGEESKWMDFVLRRGRCLSGSGWGRISGEGGAMTYTMMVEVYVTEGRQRVVSAGGGLEVIHGGFYNDGTGRWIAGAGGGAGEERSLTFCQWWCVPRSATAAEVLQRWTNVGDITVEVMLLDKKTNKTAMWYTAKTSFAQDLQDPRAIRGLGGQRTVTSGGGASTFSLGEWLHAYIGGGGEVFSCVW